MLFFGLHPHKLKSYCKFVKTKEAEGFITTTKELIIYRPKKSKENEEIYDIGICYPSHVCHIL